MSYLVPKELALAGLLHDAAEAFIGDVAAPLKRMLPDYKAIEKRVEAAVFARFGLPPEIHPEVKRADLVMLATEQRDLMPHHSDVWEWETIPGIEPMHIQLVPMSPFGARAVFMKRFQELTQPESRS